jgi:hypothetical protein
VPPAITHHGPLIEACHLPGETRADGAAPAHGNGLQLGADRFLLLVSTLAFRGVDDSLGISAQLRADRWDGPLLRELRLQASTNDWEPFGDGQRYVRQLGHPVGFGVPRGAVQHGQPLPHAGTFALLWRVCARQFAPAGHLLWQHEPPDLHPRTQAVWWLQCRLNDAGDDLVIVQPPQPLWTPGPGDTSPLAGRPVAWLNQTYTAPVPYTPDGREWAVVNHVDDGRVVPLRFRWDAAAGRYAWVDAGPLLGGGVFEASLLRWHDSWLIAARRRDSQDGVAWTRCDDPFGRVPPFTIAPGARGSPLSAYACPDGAVRLLAGDAATSPWGQKRDPLYLHEIAPDRGFAITDRQVVYAARATLPELAPLQPIVDMAKLLPHTGGATQTLLHRVRTVGFTLPDVDLGGPPLQLTPAGFAATAIYYATLTYDQPYPPTWEFAAAP